MQYNFVMPCNVRLFNRHEIKIQVNATLHNPSAKIKTRINSTYTLLLPLVFGVRHHALHALLHAPPLRQLPLQLLLPRLQLLLERALVLLVHVCRLLQDVHLASETKRWRRKKKPSRKWEGE